MSDIKKIRIKNFKNLEDVEVDFKPLTFLFGPNGSGKSSFLKALKFLHNNILPINNFFTDYNLSYDNNMGSYKNIVSNNDPEKDIEFEIEFTGFTYLPDERIFDLKNHTEYWDLIRNNTDTPYFLFENFIDALETENYFKAYDKIDFFGMAWGGCKFDVIDKIREYSIILKVKFINDENSMNLNNVHIIDKINMNSLKFNDLNIHRSPELNTNNFNPEINLLNADEYSNYFLKDLFKNISYNSNKKFEYPDIPNKEDFINGKLIINNSSGVLTQTKDYLEKKEKEDLIISNWLKLERETRVNRYFKILEFISLALRLIWDQIDIFGRKYLPPIREIPKQKYLLVNNRFPENEYYNFPNEIWNSLISKNIKIYNLSYGSDNKIVLPIIEKINNILKDMGFNKTIDIISNNDVSSIILIDEMGKITNIANESSGLIQILPVLISLAGNDLFSVEQPELHLHPKLQVKFPDVLLNSEEDRISNDSRNLILIETHSEHIIRKIQVLIAKGKLDREKIAVYYFDNIKGTTKVKKMEIEENGFFKNPWPNGFFDDSYKLSKELLFSNKN